MRFSRKYKQWKRAPVMGGHWRLRQLRQSNFGFQHEEENKLRVVIPLPGIDRETLQVKAKENMVSISVSVSEQFVKYAARPEDSWDIILDFEVLPESAKAKYVDGILTIDLDLKYPAQDVEKITYD